MRTETPAVGPRARSHGFIVRHLGDETVVYDRVMHHAHCLNRAASQVFARCDGATSPGELARGLKGSLGVDSEADAARVVELALRRLGEAGLLEGDPSLGPAVPAGATSRRTALRALAAASSAPVVLSILAPTPAEAQTCIERFDPCSSSSQCCEPFDCCRTGPFHPNDRRCHRFPLPNHQCS